MTSGIQSSSENTTDPRDVAAQLVLRRRNGPWTEAEQAALDACISNPATAAEIGRFERAWQAVGNHASAPELMVLREQALTRARRANIRRWHLPSRISRPWLVAAMIAGITVTGITAWQLSTYGFVPGVYQTNVGEQRMVELSDHSRVALDSQTRLRVRFSEDARIIELSHGQAQFTVAKDVARPFKVIAGEQTIIALGTAFTVEYVDREVRIAMLEGKVAVNSNAHPNEDKVGAAQQVRGGQKSHPRGDASGEHSVELVAGEALRVTRDGHATVIPRADLGAATAWQEGRVIFDGESLSEAVRRLNRYSRLQLEVSSPELADLKISGVFEADDTRAFADAIQSYLPVTADYSDPSTIRLKSK